MSVQYDKSVIQTFADRLYKKADSIQAIYSLVGFFAGCVGIGFFIDEVHVLWTVSGGIIGTYIGQQIGAGVGLKYRIDAQNALCLAQIEENTRNGALRSEPKPEPIDRFNILDTVKGAER